MTDQEIERWLDSTVKQYADVEPRTGLEARMLARIATEQRVRETNRWWKVMPLATAALLALLALRLRPLLETVPAPQARPRASIPAPVLFVRRNDAPVRHKRLISLVQDRASAAPKAERFPSASPLTEQEKLLVRFAQEFPHRAALVAQAQTELYKQDQKEMARPWPAKENN